jgi:hypothetical protein
MVWFVKGWITKHNGHLNNWAIAIVTIEKKKFSVWVLSTSPNMRNQILVKGLII